MKLILASQSPRRKQLLNDAHIDFEIIIEPTDESYPPDLSYDLVPEFIAEQKALAVIEKLKATQQFSNEVVVLAADTIVVLENDIIGKPKDAADAKNILRRLSGQMHEVVSGVCIMQGNKKELFHSITKVYFNTLTDDQIEFYIDQYKPFDKAGSYAIQEWIGLIGISSIEGDLYNVIGLPVNKVIKVLQAFS